MSLLVGVTTCKGRLAHLQATLVSKLAELDRLVVVDYGCPQRSGTAVERHGLERLFVVRVVDGTEAWNPGRARNAGLLFVQQTWPTARLVFVDADCYLRPGFGKWAREVRSSAVGVAGLTEHGTDVQELQGLLVVDAERLAGRGYEEDGPEYGWEDTELRYRLWAAGAELSRCPLELLEPIRHPNRQRFQFYPQPPVSLHAVERAGWSPDYPGRFCRCAS